MNSILIHLSNVIQYLHKSRQRFVLNLQGFEIDLKLGYTSAFLFKT
jgi:hypothetical protein